MGEFLASIIAETIGLFIFRLIYCIVGLPVIFVQNILNKAGAKKRSYTLENLFEASANVSLFIIAACFIAICCFGIVLGFASLAEILISKTAIQVS